MTVVCHDTSDTWYRLDNGCLRRDSVHNRALLLQQPRRNSYGNRVHPTCPGVFAMSPPA